MKTKLLIQAFIISESLFFITLILAYVYYGIYETTGPASVQSLEPETTGFFSLFLLASSITMMMGRRGFVNNRYTALKAWLGGTIVLGGIFLYGQASEYFKLYGEEVTISRNIFGSNFFTLTGFHGLHVILGLIVLCIILSLVSFGDTRKISVTAIESAEIYWHFVDAVWIVVFTVVYLIPLLI